MSDNAGSRDAERPGRRPHSAGAFDIRNFIATLVGIYGVVLVAMGLFATSQADLDRAGGLNINLWAGLGMLVVAGLFVLWARLRPVVVPDDPAERPGQPTVG